MRRSRIQKKSWLVGSFSFEIRCYSNYTRNSIFTQFSLSFYSVSTQFSLSFYSIFTQFLISFYSVFTQFLFNFYSVFTQFFISFYSVFTQFLFNFHSVFIQFLLSFYSVFYQLLLSFYSTFTRLLLTFHSVIAQFLLTVFPQFLLSFSSVLLCSFRRNFDSYLTKFFVFLHTPDFFVLTQVLVFPLLFLLSIFSLFTQLLLSIFLFSTHNLPMFYFAKLSFYSLLTQI